MTCGHLLLAFLVLLQSGLAAARGHDHPHLANHSQPPHLHVHDLLALILPDHSGAGGHDADDHDADAVDLSDLTVPAVASPEHSAAPLAFDLTPTAVAVFAESVKRRLAAHGLPPPTAGQVRPLYIVLCSLTI